MPRFLAQVTHGSDDPERATLPFIVANVAASADQETIVLLTIEGVWLATQGYADAIHHPGMPPLREVIASLLESGGRDLGVRRVHQAARHHRRAPDRGCPDHLGGGLRRRARQRDAALHLLTRRPGNEATRARPLRTEPMRSDHPYAHPSR